MIEWLHLQRRLEELDQAIAAGDAGQALNLLSFLVPGYREERPLMLRETAALNASAS